MESRILIEVEEMINKLRQEQGRPFDVNQLTTSCVANVMMSMLFAHRFDYSDPAFQQMISEIREGMTAFSFAVELFPALCIIPYFKKMIAVHIRTSKTIRSFIGDRITACSQVCSSTSWHKKSAIGHWCLLLFQIRGFYSKDQLKQLYQMLIDFPQRNTAVINTSSAHQHNLNAKKSAIVHNESKR